MATIRGTHSPVPVEEEMRKDYRIYLINDSEAYALQHKEKKRTLVFWLYKDVCTLSSASSTMAN